MRWIICGLLIPVTLVATIPARAAPPALPKPSASTVMSWLTPGSTDALAGSIRGYLVQNMPNPLHDARDGWGNTVTGRGLRSLGGGSHTPKNHGKWKHVWVTPINPADSLIFDIRNLNLPQPGQITFEVFFSMDARMEYEQQNWQNGIRLWSGGARCRFRAKATLTCQATFRFEAGDLLLPEAVLRLRVVHANVSYDQFEMEHINGVGGEMAEMIGDALRGGLNRWHPSLERDMLAKANAAIEKSADTKEVRVSLSELLKKKGWWPARGDKPPYAPT